MSIGQRLIEVLNRPVPLPAFLERPVPMPAFPALPSLPPLPACGLDGIAKKVKGAVKKARLRVRPVKSARRSGQHQGVARLFAIEGTLQGTKTGGFCIEGTPFHVNEDTFVVGELRADVAARVKGLYLPDGKRIATAVVIRECA